MSLPKDIDGMKQWWDKDYWKRGDVGDDDLRIDANSIETSRCISLIAQLRDGSNYIIKGEDGAT